jgi:hypothetical protein
MVQADISQLTGECNTWREALRQYRDELTQDKTRLQQVTTPTLSKEQLQDVEHLHNQFHIQLINIHDLKQAIKIHDRKINFEISANSAPVNEGSIADHENLFDQFQTLVHTLQELRDEFNQFLNRTQ